MQIHLVLTKVFLNSLLIEIQVKRIYADVCIVFTLKILKKKNSIITQMCVCVRALEVRKTEGERQEKRATHRGI